MDGFRDGWRKAVNRDGCGDLLGSDLCPIDDDGEGDVSQTVHADLLGVFVVHLPTGNGLYQEVAAHTGVETVTYLEHITLFRVEERLLGVSVQHPVHLMRWIILSGSCQVARKPRYFF